MLNSDLKEKALKELENENKSYQLVAKQVMSQSETLYNKRKNISMSIMPLVEKYINSLANSPKEFDKVYKELTISYHKFEKEIQLAEKEYKAAKIASAGAGAGVAAGVGVAALAPSAAIAVATTFGTASTGVAINALFGAAATNAALAWLGGGALVAGGGGMAAGNALLALAGPIGWGIGALSLLGGGYYMSSKNEEIAKEANRERIKISKQTKILKASSTEIGYMITEIQNHSEGVKKQLKYLEENAPKSYLDFSEDNKKSIMTLKNNIESLSKLLVKNINR